MPDFIIIGAPRSGTTSLYNYLTAHPCIAPALRKEVHFFDENFEKGITWYRAHFPTLLSKYYATRVRRQNFITGEATPYYIFHPLVPKRLSETIPTVKLIVLLRNPVDRAYSQYRYKLRGGVFESLSFEDVLAHEVELLGSGTEIIYRHYNCLSKGIYVDQLEGWTSRFPREQLLILKSEDFYADPQAVLKRVLDLLELPDWELKEHPKYHYGDNPKMDSSTRRRLIDFFKPHNERLYEYLGVNFGWDQ